MDKRIYIGLFLVALIGLICLARFQTVPGYMDADYYEISGLQLAQGNGFKVPFLWNYLDEPKGIPHPSHTYWMPFTSLIVWLGIVITRSLSFERNRIIFILLSSFLPPLTAALGYRMTKKKTVAILAGAFSLFSGFYFPFMATSDSFSIYWMLGLLLGFVLPEEWGEISNVKLGIIGGIIGLMHLTRSDGLFWLLPGVLLVFICRWFYAVVKNRQIGVISGIGALFLGYLVIMVPWMLRNVSVLGSPFSPYLSRSLWIREYNEMFNYPARTLTFGHWLAQGWHGIIQSRLWAAGVNLQRAVAEQGLIFLVLFILVGWYRTRKNPRIIFFSVSWVINYFMMTFIFPFAGARGGFFHASAAIQPMTFILGAVGIDEFIRWGERKRGWQGDQALRIFGSAFVFIAFALTVFVTVRQVYHLEDYENIWGKTERSYKMLDTLLVQMGADGDDIVMVGNPPGYSLMTGRKSIVIPNGDTETLLEAAKEYGADYLILDENHPKMLNDLYLHPSSSNEIHLLLSKENFYIFSFEESYEE